MTKFTKTREWLEEEYVIKNRPRQEIADECGLTLSGLKSVLKKLDIKKEKLDLPKEKLEKLVNELLSHEEIEKSLGISLTTLYRYLKKYDLKILADIKSRSKYDDSNDILIYLLYNDGFSSVEIGKEFGISHKTVLAHLQHCGVSIRSLPESLWAKNDKDIPTEFADYDLIYDLYVTLGISKKDLGAKFNCDPCVIDRILTLFGIPIRNNSESHVGLFSGEKHWNWKGGITPLARRLREYFGVNQVLKVLERDHYCCLMCGSKKQLLVHHIKHFSDILRRILEENKNLDPIRDINTLYNIAIRDKEFCDLGNLITYCKDCHHKVHGYNLLADDKSCELLENLLPESRD